MWPGRSTHWLGAFTGSFWLAVLGAALAVALLGGVIERLLLRHLYGREELYQLLFTYALVLILGDAASVLWGTQQLIVPRPPMPRRRVRALRHRRSRTTTCSSSCSGRRSRSRCWLLLSRTGTGRMIRAAAYDREMLAALGADVGRLYTLMFMAGSFLAGLGGALVTPVRSIVPGMDVDIIVEAFIVVVIGGLGSFWGTFLGALDLRPGARLRHPDPARLLDVRGVRADGAGAGGAAIGPARPADEGVTAMQPASRTAIPWAVLVFLAAACVPWLGSRFYTFLATDIAILALFAVEPEPAARLSPASSRSAMPPISASAPTPARS